MMLERFNALKGEIKASPRIRESCSSIEVFRVHNDIWYDENSEPVGDEQLLLNLNRSLRASVYWRERNSRMGFFRIPQLNAVARATFYASPKSGTLQRLNQRIQEALEHGSHAFDATHDQLTGLLNGKGYTDWARKCLKDNSIAPTTSNQTVAEETVNSSVVLFAIDIDHFKQVNDTYGHLYGDVVLQCLARRLQRCAQDLENEVSNAIAVKVARPSGEEFLILAQGALDKEQSVVWAERFRTFITDQPLPNEVEWRTVTSREHQKTLIPPPLSNRRITISIGIASTARPKLAEIDQAAGILRSQADLALYSAKSGGRNTARQFADILQKYGRVLQHHPDTGVVVIDIGRQVRVTKGQEFLVFHPDFTGSKPFVYSDGRTSKSLGVYPKYPVGRIIVFDVQPDISFCKVAQNSCAGLLPTGSHLEAIPVGSISHLVSSDSIGGVVASPNLMSAEQLSVFAKDDLPFGPKPVTVVFTLADENSLIETRGTAFINEALAKLYQAIKESLPNMSAIGQIQGMEFAAVMKGESEEDARAAVHKTIETANKLCSELTSFSAGVFTPPSEEAAEEVTPGDSSQLKDEFAIEYARYAALEAKRRGYVLVKFSVKVAYNLIVSLKSKKQYTQAIADYKALRKIGINFADIENMAALCLWESGLDKELLWDAAQRAVDLSPGNPVVYANLGVYRYKLADKLQAYHAFAKAFEIAPTWEPYEACVSPLAMSMYAAFKEGEPVDLNRLRTYLSKAKERLGRGSVSVPLHEVEAAIQDIGNLAQAQPTADPQPQA